MIVFLGGGTDAVPIVGRAMSMGLKTAVVDWDDHAPAFGMADYAIRASCYDAEETLEMLAVADIVPNAILCAGTDAPDVMAAVAAKHNLPGPSIPTARLSRDKWAQFVSLAHVVHVPRTNTSPFPIVGWTVIKPRDGRGARDVTRYRTDGYGCEVDDAWRRLSFNARASAIVQEWIPGYQLSTESIVQDGRVLWTSIAERNYSRLDEFAPNVIEDGSDMPEVVPEDPDCDLQGHVDDTIDRVAQAIGFRNGTIKGDLVWEPGRLTVIEVATRLSGGGFCSLMTPMCWDIDFVGLAIRMALGERVEVGIPKFQQYVCQRFKFPTRPRSHPDRGPFVLGFGASREEARSDAQGKLEAIK